jgi:hypothetical protein
MNNEKKLLKALYQGKLPIMGLELNCAVLDDETRILSATSIFEAFARTRSGLSKEKTQRIMATLNERIPNHGWSQIPPFLGSKGIVSLIDIDDLAVFQPIKYEDNGVVVSGYKATLLTRLCKLYLQARREGVLDRQQIDTAKQAEILLGAIADIGITALVDEATGFQYDRKKDALRLLLEKYIAEGLQKWLKRFPDKFFEELDRLYKNEKTTSRARPQYYGLFINSYIYEPLEDGYVKNELNELNIDDEGKRKARFHQWLTDFGLNQLTLQIGRVMGIMEDSKTLDECKLRLARQKGLTVLEEDLFGETERIIKKSVKDKILIMPKNNPNFETAMDKIASTVKVKA